MRMLSNFLTQEQIKYLVDNFNFKFKECHTLSITHICDMIPPTIKIGEVEYYWRLVRLNKDLWEISYINLNYIEDKRNINPVLHSESNFCVINALFNMLVWCLKNDYIIKDVLKENNYI